MLIVLAELFHHLASICRQLPERVSSKDVANTQKEEFSHLNEMTFIILYPER